MKHRYAILKDDGTLLASNKLFSEYYFNKAMLFETYGEAVAAFDVMRHCDAKQCRIVRLIWKAAPP